MCPPRPGLRQEEDPELVPGFGYMEATHDLDHCTHLPRTVGVAWLRDSPHQHSLSRSSAGKGREGVRGAGRKGWVAEFLSSLEIGVHWSRLDWLGRIQEGEREHVRARGGFQCCVQGRGWVPPERGGQGSSSRQRACGKLSALEANVSNLTNGRWRAGWTTGWHSPLVAAIARFVTLDKSPR